MALSFADPLSLPARVSVTATTLVLVLVTHRALFRRSSPQSARAGAIGLGAAFVVAAAFAHVDALTDTLAVTFPIGVGLGMAAAIASLFFDPARRAFDSLTDTEVRVLLSFRAIYGALLLALGAIGHFPVSFAISAGLGDLAVTWVAFAMPASLGADGPTWDVVRFPHAVVVFAGPARTRFDEMLATAGERRHVAVVLSSFLAVPYVLAESDALAVLPAPFAQKLADEGRIRFAPLPRALAPPPLRMRLVWPERLANSTAWRWLREQLVRAVSAHVAP